MIVINRLFFRKPYVGLTIWPFIILREKQLKADKSLINHERIHLRQQLELLLIPFYVLYIGEWLVRSLIYLDFYKGYRNLSFEREAYLNENDLQYLHTRKPFSFFHYF